MEESIKLGVKIRNKLGSTFKELEMLRKGTWANAVILDHVRSQQDSTHTKKFKDEDLAKADQYLEELMQHNAVVEEMLSQAKSEDFSENDTNDTPEEENSTESSSEETESTDSTDTTQ